ncbi:MAG: hypothetical protein ACXAEU_15390 [Candidatus Hodarchaeales archaeon]
MSSNPCIDGSRVLTNSSYDVKENVHDNIIVDGRCLLVDNEVVISNRDVIREEIGLKIDTHY